MYASGSSYPQASALEDPTCKSRPILAAVDGQSQYEGHHLKVLLTPHAEATGASIPPVDLDNAREIPFGITIIEYCYGSLYHPLANKSVNSATAISWASCYLIHTTAKAMEISQGYF